MKFRKTLKCGILLRSEQHVTPRIHIILTTALLKDAGAHSGFACPPLHVLRREMYELGEAGALHNGRWGGRTGVRKHTRTMFACAALRVAYLIGETVLFFMIDEVWGFDNVLKVWEFKYRCY